MKIDLKDQRNKNQINSVRNQITDIGSLQKFDEFIAKHDAFDFDDDEHLKALKKQSCTCTVTVPITVKQL